MIVEVDISTFLLGANGSAVPPNLVGYLDQNQWNAITNSIKGAHSQATAMAWFLEIGCCIVFAFPCIFCCHPFVVGVTSQDTIRGSLRQLNSAYFNGVDVLSSTRAGYFTVNTDKLLRAPPAAQVRFLPQQPVPVPVSQVAYYEQPQSYAQPPVYGQIQPSYAQPQTYGQSPVYASQQYYDTPQNHQYYAPTAANDKNASISYAEVASPSSPSLYGTAAVPAHPYPATAPPYAETVPHATPTNVQPLSEFLLTIPPGAPQGSIMSVVNPHGVTMRVTVPPGAQPGSQILIKYQV